MARPERALRGDGGPIEQFAIDLRQLREAAGRPGYRELARKAHFSPATLSEAAGGRRFPTLPVALAYATACGADPVKWEARWRAAAARLADVESDATRADPDEPSPYLGSRAYDSADAEWFFGRRRLVAELVDRLAHRRLLAVVGPSGVGKSSLLRAGLVPAVRDTSPSGDGPVRVAVLTPGPEPMARLAEARQTLSTGPRRSLLVVDQFEEIFTECPDGTQRDRFVATLLDLAGSAADEVHVVLGIRADQLARCAARPGLAAALADAVVRIGPMTAVELHDAVTGPAHRAGLRLQQELVSTIVSEGTRRAGTLPLVSHALLQTWQRRRGSTLTLADYQADGGIGRLVARQAEDLHCGLDPDSRLLLRDVLLRLVDLDDVGEPAPRRAELAEFGPGRHRPMVDLLAAARLVTVHEHTVELANDALPYTWPRLARWLAEDRAGLRLHRRIGAATREWSTSGRDSGVLLRGTRLTAARRWAAQPAHAARLSRAEQEFLTASIDQQRRDRRRTVRGSRLSHALTASLLTLLLVATSVSVSASLQRDEAVRAQQSAISRLLATQALTVVDSQPDTGVLLSVEAFRVAQTTEARSALLSMSAHQAHLGRLGGHQAAVTDVAFDPDGEVLATSSRDHTVALWDNRRREPLTTLTGHTAPVNGVAFSPDARLVASASDDHTVIVWDVARRAPLTTLTGHNQPVLDVAFSPDGSLAATAGADGTTRLWDTARWTPLSVLDGHTDRVNKVAFSPQAQLLATASDDHTVIVWDVVRRAPLTTLTGHSQPVLDIAFSPDGYHLTTASRDGTVILWDCSGNTRWTWSETNIGQVTAIAFSPDGSTLVAAGRDRVVRLWDTAHQTVRARMAGHAGRINAMAVDPRTGMIASAGESHTTLLWDPTGPSLALPEPADRYDDVAYSPDGHALATANGTSVIVWDGRRRVRGVLGGHPGRIDTIAFSPDSQVLAAGGRDGTITLWNPTKRIRLGALTGHDDRILDVAFAPDGRTLASGSADRTVRLWDLTDHRPLATLTGHRGSVDDVAFHPDEPILATAGHDATVRLWNLTTRSPLGILAGHSGAVSTVVFSPDGRTLASGSADRTVRLWQTDSRALLATLADHSGAASGTGFSPDGRLLAHSTTDGGVQLWDVTQDAPVASLTGHSAPVTAVAFSPDGRTLASTGLDQRVILWGTDPQAAASRACTALIRNLTREEWRQFLPGMGYQETCRPG